MKKLFISMMAAGAILFALPSCDQLAGLIDAAQEEEQENNDPQQEETGETLPPYGNINLVETDNQIVLSFTLNAANEKYYDADFTWNFRDDVCVSASHSFVFSSELMAKAVYLSEKDEYAVTIDGAKLTYDDTEEFKDQPKEEVSTYAQQLKLSMEIINEESAKQE